MKRKLLSDLRCNFKKHKTSEDGFYTYYFSIYYKAIDNLNKGKKMKALSLLRKGSKEYSDLFYLGVELNSLIEDRCSLWLCKYLTQNNKPRMLRKILKRNFVCYEGDYYPLTTSDIVWRMIPINELEPDWDFGVDAPESEINDIVLELIRERRRKHI